MAADNMRGRRAGTLDELRAGAWVAEQARKAGLEPAGDDGTYFQFFHLRRTRVSAASSRIELNGTPLILNKDVWATAPLESQLNLPVEWLASLSDTSRNLQGKAVAMALVPPSPLPAKGMSLWGYRYTATAVRQQAAILRNHGAACVILVANPVAEAEISFIGHNYQEGSYQLDNAGPIAIQPARNTGPVLLVHASAASALQQSAATLTATIRVESFLYPSVNVVASAKGTDPALSKEFVLFSGHHDHDGVGQPVAGDSIWNGADDNATVSVALLAIARAWKGKPGKRSALFVWHGAEERGLLGSRWYAEHPTVKKEAIVAVLNGDMMGRNSPDSAALLGAVPPHRNSATLVDMAMQANRDISRFTTIDTSWDDPKHPEGWYFRSDHLSYARVGIPAIFFTTLLHADYHTPRDGAKTIDIAKLTRMTRWMYATGWSVSQTAQRPALDQTATTPSPVR